MKRPRPVEFKLELPEPPTRFEGSMADFCEDMRGADRVDMSPRAYEGTIWDDLADRRGQHRLTQQANKSRALATWRDPASKRSAG